MVILRGNDITLRWTITKCLDGSEVPEDFSGADLSVFILSLYDRVRVKALVEGNVITVSIPGNIQKNGKIGIEAVWSKNNGKNWSRAKQVDVLGISDDPKRVTYCCSGADVDIHTVEIRSSMFGGLGYDGVTPEIINGNWWIGSVDTGISAIGPQGEDFTFEDFTPEQINMLKQPAVDAAKEVAELESAISLNEQGRIQAEQNRAQAERDRSLSEQGRVENESTRVANEELRIQVETVRDRAEVNRLSAEQLRVQGEEKRISEEQKRVSAEQSREAEEQKRVTASSEAVRNCEAAATHATEQGDYAKTQGDAAKSAAEQAIDAKMSLFIDMWNLECAYYKNGRYNASTGFFELNGLTDITYEQALCIFNDTVPHRRSTNLAAQFQNSRIRTNLTFIGRSGGGGSDYGRFAEDVFRFCNLMEIVNVGGRFRMSSGAGAWQYSGMFAGCIKLRKIIGNIDFMFRPPAFYDFENCVLLEEVSIAYLSGDISFRNSPLLQNESILKCISGSNSQKQYTITLHPDAYARATSDETIVAKALEKNIILASA